MELPLILIVSGVVLLLGGLWRKRTNERAARHRQIPLAKVPKREAAKPVEPGTSPDAASIAPHDLRGPSRPSTPTSRGPLRRA